ncbi:EmrB/QacA subfamily drug resistance transporter [Amycolatopsis bartoniae]|uniref:MFS transporter n=1 Tax=Amycolatopsis bartoniae TaxID=941986 RepID=UPI00178F4EE3|nr:MFS transporter [Amycolatopsis bartoniae]MBB2937838.1 EmrB/QacA subfamily drug resistance transporter [Amycolatopsis bartoniae]
MGFQRGVALLVAAAFFMEILDSTVIAPAVPRIAGDFGVSAVAVNVAITAYVLTVGVLIPVSGWLAVRFGVRRVFCLALAVFVLASAGCAVAPDLAVLTGCRVVQGAGGAMMVPVGRLAVLRTTPKPDLVRAIAYLTWPALLAPVVAPVAGGLLAEYASWRWIFLVNVPLGLAALAVAVRIVPRSRAERPPPFDLAGFVLTAVAVGALIVALDGLGSGFGPRTAVALVVAVVALVLSMRHLLRARHPLVDLRTLRVRTYRLTAASGSVYRAVITSIPFLLPLLFQLGFGWSPAQAGAAVIALFAGNVGIKPATTPLMRRFGIRRVLLGAIAAGAACLVGMAFVRAATPLPLLLALLVASGVARSIGFTAYNSIAFADVPPERMTHANTLFSALQELGAGLGVAAGALLIRLGQAVVPGPVGPYGVACVLLALILLGPAVAAWRLPVTAGDAVTGR